MPAVEGRALGRRAPKGAPALRLGQYLTGAVPPHPVSADHFEAISDWGLYANDTYGDCGPVSVANSRKLITRYLGGAEAEPTQDDVFALYRLVNPTFDPADPGGPGDAGVDMQTMLELAAKHGFAGVKPVAYAKVDHTNVEELHAAIAVFGCLLLGVDLQAAQQTQTDHALWDYQPSPQWGGHAVLAGRYSGPPVAAVAADSAQDRTAVVTWAKVVDTTDAFLGHQLSEAWVVIWPEHLGSASFLNGVDLPTLAADYKALTGRTLPVPAPPGSAPNVSRPPLCRLLGALTGLWRR